MAISQGRSSAQHSITTMARKAQDRFATRAPKACAGCLLCKGIGAWYTRHAGDARARRGSIAMASGRSVSRLWVS